MFEKIARYFRYAFIRDISAGLTVAFVSIPQAIALAFVAGFSPSTGIIASIIGPCIYAALGASRYLVLGPTSLMAILVQSGIGALVEQRHFGLSQEAQEALRWELLVLLVTMVGILQLLAGLLNFGQLTNFVSQPVMMAYSVGIVIAIVLNQLYPLCGLMASENAYSLAQKAQDIFERLGHIDFVTTGMGLGCLIFLFGSTRVLPKPLQPLVMLIVSAVVAHFYFPQVETVRNLAVSPNLFDKMAIPSFRYVNQLLPSALAIAALGMVETINLGKTASLPSAGKKGAASVFSLRGETIALGLSNLFGGIMGAMPSSGSTSRTAVNKEMRAKTHAAGAYSSLCILAIVTILYPLVQYIPVAALCVLVLAATPKLVDSERLKICLRTSFADASVFLCTLFACIFFSMQEAFFIGTALSIAIYLKQSSNMSCVEYVFDKSGRMKTLPLNHPSLRSHAIRIIHLEGEIFFGAAELIPQALEPVIAQTKAKAIILDLQNARHIDASACLVFKTLYDQLALQDRTLIGANVPQEAWEVFEASGILKHWGKEKLYLSDPNFPRLGLPQAILKAEDFLQER